MARIRSLHPGQWTDEDFIACSFQARLLALALRNEADDNGIFEWKPLTIKMRIFPADNLDVPDLLNELVRNQQMFHYSIGDRSYGIIRNFQKFQRPKKPSFVYPVPERMPNGYELNPAYKGKSSAQVPNQSGTGTELGPQMKEKEEGVVKEEEGGGFRGKVIRFSAKELADWQKTYHGIPDLPAELAVIDAKFAVDPDGDWYVKLSGWLNKKHQRLVTEQRKREEKPLPKGEFARTNVRTI